MQLGSLQPQRAPARRGASRWRSGLAAAAPAAAQAGTYDVYGCKDPATGLPIGPDAPSGWSVHESDPGENNYASTQTCSSSLGGIGIAPYESPNHGATMTADNSHPRTADVSFTAPANTVDAGIRAVPIA